MKSIFRHIEIKLLATNDKEKKNLETAQKLVSFLWGNKGLNDFRFLTRNHKGGRKGHAA